MEILLGDVILLFVITFFGFLGVKKKKTTIKRSLLKKLLRASLELAAQKKK